MDIDTLLSQTDSTNHFINMECLPKKKVKKKLQHRGQNEKTTNTSKSNNTVKKKSYVFQLLVRLKKCQQVM